MALLRDAGVTTFELTAIARDGLLEGPDLDLLAQLVSPEAGSVIASGGISSLADIRAVADLGCAGAIIGRALYELRIDLGEAVAWASRV
jgi:phosphoribosylformimino-5-aminoimidazole carboxamide ribonucleotide (ProFAR) isomerase